MNRVPKNQSVSFTVYVQAINKHAAIPAQFVRDNIDRITKAFDIGEPIWMIADEMKLRYQMQHHHTKTPRQLAQRVVRV